MDALDNITSSLMEQPPVLVTVQRSVVEPANGKPETVAVAKFAFENEILALAGTTVHVLLIPK
jgi:hypothetical protein